jgi:hypothetical protein
MRFSRTRGVAIVAAFLFARVPAAAAAQYPLVPTPVLPLGTLSSSVKVSGYVSVRDTRHGDSTSFSVNRARLTAMMAPLPYLAVRVQADFSGNQSETVGSDNTVHGFELTDAYVELAQAAADSLKWGQWHPALIVGQFKQPFSLEYLTSFAYLRTANRSTAIDQLTPKRDIGVMGQVQWSHYVTADASVTNGQGANALANPNGLELLIGRLTVTPVPWLALAAKLGNEGTDHVKGYDARIEWRDLIVEGEGIHRSRPLGGAHQDAGGGYVLAAYKVLPWLEPVFKREWFNDTRQSDGTNMDTWQGWSTFGVNLMSPKENLRLVTDWVVKSQRPTHPQNEVVVQLIANF